jgi:hypothetical protein
MKLTLSRLIFIFPALFLLHSCGTVKPLAPAVNTADVPKIVQPTSNIEIPVTIELKKYFLQAENAVPSVYSDSKKQVEGLSYTYTFKRTPFAITGSDNTVSMKLIGSYGISASYCAKSIDFGSGTRCLVPVVSASCGMENEPLRRMEINFKSVISVKPDYSLASKTGLWPPPRAIDKCNISILKIDVTDKLIEFVSVPLSDLGTQIDKRIASMNFKPVIAELWKNIANEYKLGDMGYLYLNPQSVRVSNFNLNGSQLNFSVGLSANPVVSTTSLPQQPKPLPNLSAYTPASGFSIYLDIFENYEHLTNLVNQQIVNQQMEVAGKQFIVTDTKVYGTGSKIAVAVDFKGSMTGTVYLVGTPSYDPVKRVISFPDMNFDVYSKNWMIKFAKWMFNEKITNMIREKATYNLTQFLNDSKTRLKTELSRDLGNGVKSNVYLDDVNIDAIYPTTDRLILRTFSKGQIKVNVVM